MLKSDWKIQFECVNNVLYHNGEKIPDAMLFNEETKGRFLILGKSNKLKSQLLLLTICPLQSGHGKDAVSREYLTFNFIS